MATAMPKGGEKIPEMKTNSTSTEGSMTSVEKVASLRFSIRSHRGHFTREWTFLKHIAAGEFPDPVRMNALVDGLQVRIEKIADIADTIVDMNPEAGLEHKPLIDELMDHLGEAGRLASSAGRSRLQNEGIPGRLGHFKPASDLRPPILSQESTPPEMREWINKFKAFHAASNMSTLGIDEEKEYLLSRIEGSLATTLRGNFQTAASIADCFRLLEARFLELHPLFRRRLSWFEQKKERGQKLIDFYHKLRSIGEEAELDKLDIDDLHMFQSIYACRNEPELFFKLLDVQNPSLADILATGTAFESAKET